MEIRPLVYAVLALVAVLWMIADILLTATPKQLGPGGKPVARAGLIAPFATLVFALYALLLLWGAP